MVDLGGLLAAVPAGPAVPMQDRAAQHRVDAALGRIGRGRIPVQEWVGEIGTHSLIAAPADLLSRNEPRPLTKVSVSKAGAGNR